MPDNNKALFPAHDQTHSFDAVVMVWTGDNRNYGMKLTIENVDSCCEEHARSSAANVASAVKCRMQEVWQTAFSYEVTKVTQRW